MKRVIKPFPALVIRLMSLKGGFSRKKAAKVTITAQRTNPNIGKVCRGITPLFAINGIYQKRNVNARKTPDTGATDPVRANLAMSGWLVIGRESTRKIQLHLTNRSMILFCTGSNLLFPCSSSGKNQYYSHDEPQHCPYQKKFNTSECYRGTCIAACLG